jgi:hypothetical protein
LEVFEVGSVLTVVETEGPSGSGLMFTTADELESAEVVEVVVTPSGSGLMVTAGGIDVSLLVDGATIGGALVVSAAPVVSTLASSSAIFGRFDCPSSAPSTDLLRLGLDCVGCTKPGGGTSISGEGVRSISSRRTFPPHLANCDRLNGQFPPSKLSLISEAPRIRMKEVLEVGVCASPA